MDVIYILWIGVASWYAWEDGSVIAGVIWPLLFLKSAWILIREWDQ